MRELSGDEREDFAGEALGLDPGEHEEAGVVDDELQIASSPYLILTDEALAHGELPGAGAEADQGDARGEPVAKLDLRRLEVGSVVPAFPDQNEGIGLLGPGAHDHIVVRAQIGAKPELRPALVRRDGVTGRREGRETHGRSLEITTSGLRRASGVFLRLMSDHSSFLHHKGDRAQHADIIEWVLAYGYYVCSLSGLDGSQLTFYLH